MVPCLEVTADLPLSIYDSKVIKMYIWCLEWYVCMYVWVCMYVCIYVCMGEYVCMYVHLDLFYSFCVLEL